MDEDEEAGLDPIALTLAVWLGLVVIVTGIARMSNPNLTAAAPEMAGRVAAALAEPGNPQLLAFIE